MDPSLFLASSVVVSTTVAVTKMLLSNRKNLLSELAKSRMTEELDSLKTERAYDEDNANHNYKVEVRNIDGYRNKYLREDIIDTYRKMRLYLKKQSELAQCRREFRNKQKEIEQKHTQALKASVIEAELAINRLFSCQDMAVENIIHTLGILRLKWNVNLNPGVLNFVDSRNRSILEGWF